MSSNDGRPRTLQGVIEAIQNDETLAKATKSELITGTRTFCRCVGRDPSEILAIPSALRALERHAKPKLLGLSAAHFGNSMSRLRKALAHVGIPVDRRRAVPLGRRWAALLSKVGGTKAIDLRKLAGWCSARDIEPRAVSQEVFDEFYEYLKEQSIQHNLKERWHRARRAWNDAVALEGSGYPSLANSFADGDKLTAIADFPSSFLAELRDYQRVLTTPRIFAAQETTATKTDRGAGLVERLSGLRRKPMSPVTANGYGKSVTLLAKYLVADEMPIDQFTSLDSLLDPALVLRGLARMQADILAKRGNANQSNLASAQETERHRPDDPLPIIGAVAKAVLSIAKFKKVGGARLTAIRSIAANARFERSGMTAKNKSRLNQLVDPRVKKALLDLPAKIFARYAEVEKGTFKQAREAQNATMLAVLLELPIRLGNVTCLDLDRHLQRPVLAGRGKWLLSIPGHEVKNGEDISGEFTEDTSAMLDRYVRVFRPALCSEPTSVLFVSRTGRAKRNTTTSVQFTQFIRRETGLQLNPHILRHFAANNWLVAHPQDAETARLLLGHRSIDTTRKFYTDVNQRRSFRLYHGLLDDLREEPAGSPGRTFDFGRRKRGGSK
jgi:integrase